MRIFGWGKPKRLLSVSHVTARRDQKELIIRFVFDERPAIDAKVSFDTVEQMARMFAHLAVAVDQRQSDSR